jgi:hypothetical protein
MLKQPKVKNYFQKFCMNKYKTINPVNSNVAWCYCDHHILQWKVYMTNNPHKENYIKKNYLFV